MDTPGTIKLQGTQEAILFPGFHGWWWWGVGSGGWGWGWGVLGVGGWGGGGGLGKPS